MNELTLTNLASEYIHRSQTDLNFSSSKSNTTNTSSSSNSLAFNDDEEDVDDYLQSKKDLANFKLGGGTPTTSSSANSINNHISNSSQLIASLTSSLIRTDPRSSSSSTTSSSNESNSSNDIYQTTSTTTTPTTVQTGTAHKYVFLLNAVVNGFAQLKLCADKIDFEYIIEVYWSDDTRTYVKRTYADFVTFHGELTRVFSQFFNEIKSNVNMKALKYNSTKNKNMKTEYLMPVLPNGRKPFWVSHLKLAETREAELSDYVERIFKLPTHIVHSELVLKFFKSQSSDPKPVRLNDQANSAEHNNSIMSSTSGAHHQSREICMSNIEFDDEHNDIESDDDDNNSNFEFEDELDCDDNDCVDQYLNSFQSNHQKYNNLPISNSMIGLNRRGVAGAVNREAGLWWDEDEALNELTSSMSFDFGSHNNTNAGKQYSTKLTYDDGSDDLETLKTLEKILKSSELFRNDTNSISSASSNILKLNENQMMNKRLSLS